MATVTPVMATMRWNPLASRWVVLSTARASRPEMLGGPRRDCPFCPGGEAQTTETIATYGGDERTWRVRVFRNRYPAFDEVPARGARGSRGRERPAFGRHEVVVLTPDHTADPADLDDEQLAYVFRALADETRREILDFLRAGPRTSGEIADQFESTWPTISRHLAVLRPAASSSPNARVRRFITS